MRQSNVDANQHFFARDAVRVRELDWRASLPTLSCPGQAAHGLAAADEGTKFEWSASDAAELSQVAPMQELSLCKLLLVFRIERCDAIVYAAWESLKAI